MALRSREVRLRSTVGGGLKAVGEGAVPKDGVVGATKVSAGGTDAAGDTAGSWANGTAASASAFAAQLFEIDVDERLEVAGG